MNENKNWLLNYLYPPANEMKEYFSNPELMKEMINSFGGVGMATVKPVNAIGNSALSKKIMEMLSKKHYPRYEGFNPIHPVQDWAKVRKLIRDVKRGDKINPFLVEGERNNGNLLTGTHRAAANELMKKLGYPEEMMIPHVAIEDLSNHKFINELLEAAGESDFERLNNIWDL